MLHCPNCRSHDLGRVGTNQYYCWSCFIELTVENEEIAAVYQVEEDGSLSSLDDLFLQNKPDSRLALEG